MKTIVSDTSPLVAFAFLGLQDMLPRILGEVIIPPAVAREIGQPRYGFNGVDANELPGVITRRPTDAHFVQQLRARVDEGEAEALALAVEIHAELIVIDDAAARSAAHELGLVVTGTLGLLLRAKQANQIVSVKPLLDRLRNELRFFLSDSLYQYALTAAGE